MLKSALSVVYKIYIYGFIHLGICTVALVYFTSKSIQKSVPLAYYLMLFCGTLTLYNLYAKLGQKKLYPSRLAKIGDGLIIISTIIGIFSIKYFQNLGWLLFVPGVLIAALYVASEVYPRLRYPKYLHPFVISGVFVYFTSIIPMLLVKTHVVWAMTTYYFLFIFALCLLFDIGDLEADTKRKYASIPALIGIENTKLLTYLICIAMCLLGIFGPSSINVFAQLSMILTAIILGIFTNISRSNYNKIYYLFWIDGLMLLPALIYGILDAIGSNTTLI